eukprot:CAMPEP_0206533372 /NCGR_PEP_ID=MMETSP0325_2-20121206/4916_1 /ASSEMBLY_ACC=CAM_ASM_000347 /TAXON_ID=2866 /ORGANISM="Crypthecodinium cohnii, Strain Seligo" /LENGTH=191 /DNA_ID=CAMNT_0054029983 /DNA_START=127 /DNA_END=699 /DNA_ORIENTATION=+
MQRTIEGEHFRGMYPHLMYSARLFEVLTRCPEYAEVLAGNSKVIPMLLHVAAECDRPLRVESDHEGRRLALEALRHLAQWKLWPPPAEAIARPSMSPVRSLSRSPTGSEDMEESLSSGTSRGRQLLVPSRSPTQRPSFARRCLLQESNDFINITLPNLLYHEHQGIRLSAAGLWAHIHKGAVRQQMLTGVR